VLASCLWALSRSDGSPGEELDPALNRSGGKVDEALDEAGEKPK